MIISGQKLKFDYPNAIQPMFDRSVHPTGLSYGLSGAGYDVRVKQGLVLPPQGFSLASTVEYFEIPNDLIAVLHDKSTMARNGLSVFNTVLENGWCGWLTLELANKSDKPLRIEAGQPIGQLLFHRIEGYAEPYRGKYFNQPNKPVEAIAEKCTHDGFGFRL